MLELKSCQKTYLMKQQLSRFPQDPENYPQIPPKITPYIMQGYVMLPSQDVMLTSKRYLEDMLPKDFVGKSGR